MKKILLVCNLGMSTSMLVQRMEVNAQQRNIEVEIAAKPFTDAEKEFTQWDVILLGPQVRHQLKKLEKTVGNETPISVIDMKDYGLMNGENVLNAALDLINNK